MIALSVPLDSGVAMTGAHGIQARIAPAAVDELIPTLDSGALGGAPLPEPAHLRGESDKQARKRHKREAKLHRDAERPPDSFERFRILMEMISEGRQVVDLADHKARYALVIIGVLNAGVFFLLSRAHLIRDVSPAVKPWLLGFLVAYAFLTFVFVLHAVDCLRPRHLHYAQLLSGAGRSTGHDVRPGLMYWEAIAGYDLEAYQHAWGAARMEQINSEVVVIAHRLALLIRAKYAALGRLYLGLVILVVLAAVLLTLYAGFALTA
jgi:hypothetical protein